MKIKVDYIEKEIDLEKYLYSTINFHLNNTPFWKKQRERIKLDEIITERLEDLIPNLLSELYVEQDYLRNRWIEFLPKSAKNLRISQSSGTTGKRKFCFWSNNYIEILTDYLSFYLDKIYNLPHGINAIIHGPYGVYQSVNQRLINKRGGIPYAISIETYGMKKVLESVPSQQLTSFLKEYFEPLIEDTKRFLEADENIKLIRSAWMFLKDFEEFFGKKFGIECVMTSGLNYSPQLHEFLSSQWKKVIPSYGYFAFGDALGIYENKELKYYPPFPFCIFSVVNGKNEVVKYGEVGNPVFIIARDDSFLVLKENDEFAKRVQPNKYFNWDGISNPRREI